MPIKGYDIEVEQGATLNIEFVWKQANGSETPVPKDLSGFTARMHARETPEDPVPFVVWTTENNGIVLGGVNGTVKLVQSATATSLIQAGSFFYDMELVDPSGVVYRFLSGRFSVVRNITR